MSLLPNERIDDLQFRGLKIIQNPQYFCFGMDAVLLAHFARLKKTDRAADLGTGTGILPLLLWGRYQFSHMTGLEIQPAIADMASRSIRLNNLESRISILNEDLRNYGFGSQAGTMDAVISNPPYKKAGSGLPSQTSAQALARHEITCRLEDVISCAARLLRNGGKFFTINHSDRIIEIIELMRQYKIEPKRFRLIQPRASLPPNLVLAEGVKNARPHVSFEPALIIYNEDGSPTLELDKIYHRI